MSQGQLTSRGDYSSLKYNGSPFDSEFILTTENQQLVKLEKEDSTPENPKLHNCNSVSISAGSEDLYFSVLTDRNQIDTFDFTGSPVYVCKANDTITLSGLPICAIKFSNGIGSEYLVQAFTY